MSYRTKKIITLITEKIITLAVEIFLMKNPCKKCLIKICCNEFCEKKNQQVKLLQKICINFSHKALELATLSLITITASTSLIAIYIRNKDDSFIILGVFLWFIVCAGAFTISIIDLFKR